MIIKFRIISTEKEEFVRDIELPSDSSFLDLHLSIQTSCEYDESIMSSFYISDKSWDKGQEIAMQIMDENEQKSVLLMEKVKLDKFISEVGNRLLYLYDFFSVRFFFIEVVNVREKENSDKDIEYPVCTFCQDIPPPQILVDDLDDLDDLDSDDDDEFNDFEDMGFDNIDDYNL